MMIYLQFVYIWDTSKLTNEGTIKLKSQNSTFFCTNMNYLNSDIETIFEMFTRFNNAVDSFKTL